MGKSAKRDIYRPQSNPSASRLAARRGRVFNLIQSSVRPERVGRTLGRTLTLRDDALDIERAGVAENGLIRHWSSVW
jgi:hypothetical protein